MVEKYGKYIYAYKNTDGTTTVISYDQTNTALHFFLKQYDIRGSYGEQRRSNSGCIETKFECPSEFLEELKTNEMQKVIRNLGAAVVMDIQDCCEFPDFSVKSPVR